MLETELVIEVHQQRRSADIDILTIQYPGELIVVDIGIYDRRPPFGHRPHGADRDPGILAATDIAVADDGCLSGLLEGFRKEVDRIAIVQCRRQPMLVSMR